MPKPSTESTRIKRAIAKLRDQGIQTQPFETGKVILGDNLQYVLTHAELLHLMDNDELTLQGVKKLHRELKKRLGAPPDPLP